MHVVAFNALMHCMFSSIAHSAFLFACCSPTPYNFTASPPSVNHTQDMHPHHGPAKAEKRVQIMRSNFFSEEKQDVESGNRSLDTPDDQKNRSMDSNADAAGATAVFQAHSIGKGYCFYVI